MGHIHSQGVLHARWLRVPGEHVGEVQPVERFFDLVYALAVTQLTHHLLYALSLRGALETLAVLWGVWAGWICVTWISNCFDVRTRPVRLALLIAAFVGLVLASSIPEAFRERGMTLALAVIVLIVGTPLLGLAAVGAGHALRPVLFRVAIWDALAGALWLAASVVIGIVLYAGFPLPGFGRNRTTDYTITGIHMAEHCLLFVILAIGESVLITGEGFGELPHTRSIWAAFTVAFVGSVAFWWIYFDRISRAQGAAVVVLLSVAGSDLYMEHRTAGAAA